MKITEQTTLAFIFSNDYFNFITIQNSEIQILDNSKNAFPFASITYGNFSILNSKIQCLNKIIAYSLFIFNENSVFLSNISLL